MNEENIRFYIFRLMMLICNTNILFANNKNTFSFIFLNKKMPCIAGFFFKYRFVRTYPVNFISLHVFLKPVF